MKPREITMPLRKPFEGYRKPRPKPTTKRGRDDELVHELLEYLRNKTGRSKLDGDFGPNYDACAALVARCGDRDARKDITLLIDAIFSGHPKMEFHVRKATNFRYLHNYAGAIANDIRAVRAASPKDIALAEIRSRLAAGG